MEQELLTLSEHLSSSPVFSGVFITRSLVLCVYFVDRCLFFCPFSFGHCSVLLQFTDSDSSLVSSISSDIDILVIPCKFKDNKLSVRIMI